MTQRTLSRRTVLGGAAALAGAAVLAGCGSDDSAEADGADAEGADVDGADEGDDSDASSADGDDTTTEGGDGLIATSEVPVGGGVIVGAAQVVVTQPTEGEFKGFSSTCTHQGCQVTSVDADVITCACHNSKFSIEDGSVLGGPASTPLPEVDVAVSGDQVVPA